MFIMPSISRTKKFQELRKIAVLMTPQPALPSSPLPPRRLSPPSHLWLARVLFRSPEELDVCLRFTAAKPNFGLPISVL